MNTTRSSPVSGPTEDHRLCRRFPEPWPQRLALAAMVGEPGSDDRIKAINTEVLQMHLAGLCDVPAPAGLERGKWGRR